MDAFHARRRAAGYTDRDVLRKHLCLPTGIKGYAAEWQGTGTMGTVWSTYVRRARAYFPYNAFTDGDPVQRLLLNVRRALRRIAGLPSRGPAVARIKGCRELHPPGGNCRVKPRRVRRGQGRNSLLEAGPRPDDNFSEGRKFSSAEPSMERITSARLSTHRAPRCRTAVSKAKSGNIRCDAGSSRCPEEDSRDSTERGRVIRIIRAIVIPRAKSSKLAIPRGLKLTVHQTA